jgi:hypothetical protein
MTTNCIEEHVLLTGVTSLCHWFTHRSGCIILKPCIITSFNCTSPLLSVPRYGNRTINHRTQRAGRQAHTSSSCGRADILFPVARGNLVSLHPASQSHASLSKIISLKCNTHAVCSATIEQVLQLFEV